MLGSSVPSESWIEPPLFIGQNVHGCATTDLGPPYGGTRREREFAAGRRCAARALNRAGATELAVGTGPHRKPIWPPGFAGSITHTPTLAWAVATRITHLRSIGIDSEPIFDEVALRDAAPIALDEAEWRLARHGDEAEGATLVFSAKESLFKCLSPCVGEFFEFGDVQLDDIARGTGGRGAFELRLLRPLGEFACGRRFSGRYIVSRNHVHTAVELPP
jgi:enterobactin synthetase component D